MDTNTVEQQAARWLVDLDTGGPRVTPQMLFEFGEWLALDPDHVAAYRRLKAAWDWAGATCKLADRHGLLPDDWFGIKG